jgi:hypothetical protein
MAGLATSIRIAPEGNSINIFVMKAIIQLSREEEMKALPILLRHSPGMILRERTYVLSEDALRALRDGGVRFAELSREAVAPGLEEVPGERV